jgi:hypothetical protein
MTYRPHLLTQLGKTPCANKNCGVCCAGMAADRARKGIDPNNKYAWPPTAGDIRRQISGTWCRPTTLEDCKRAVKALYGVDLTIRYNIPRANFRSLIMSGRGAIMSIRYSVIHGTKFDASPNFYGNHGIFVNERRLGGFYLVYDPLADGRRKGIPKGPQWWPGNLLYAAGQAYPGTNADHVHAAFTRDTEV